MTTNFDQQEFNPSDYGFSNRFCKRSSGSAGRCENQKIWMYSKKSDDSNVLCLKMPPSIGEQVVNALGERVNFDTNERGQILLWSGSARKVSSNRSKGGKWTISMNMAYDEYVSYMGLFSRLEMDVEFFDNRVLFTPNGKRRP